jgi:hypothetical protein
VTHFGHKRECPWDSTLVTGNYWLSTAFRHGPQGSLLHAEPLRNLVTLTHASTSMGVAFKGDVVLHLQATGANHDENSAFGNFRPRDR